MMHFSAALGSRRLILWKKVIVCGDGCGCGDADDNHLNQTKYKMLIQMKQTGCNNSVSIFCMHFEIVEGLADLMVLSQRD